VLAIARQTATRDLGWFAIFTERIRALAATQDLLIRSEWRGAAWTIWCALSSPTWRIFSDLGSCARPKLHLNAAATQAVGLARHELATNAGKYGALSTDAGRIEVTWRVDDDAFAMNWTESGGPSVRPPERQGFGTTVIDTMVKRTLGGEVQLAGMAIDLLGRRRPGKTLKAYTQPLARKGCRGVALKRCGRQPCPAHVLVGSFEPVGIAGRWLIAYRRKRLELTSSPTPIRSP
jgi:hypothetical protein